MRWLPFIGCALLGLGVSGLVISLTLRVCRFWNLTRHRELHHTHKTPVPRLGGLALAVAFLTTELFISFILPEYRSHAAGRPVVILSALAMFALGFCDDLRPIGAKRKLLGQVLIALSVHCAGLGIQVFKLPFSDITIQLGGWGVFFTVLWLVGITNLVNLIDGVDGLAGGISLMLMALLAYVGYASGTFSLLNCGMVGAILAFLWFNFPPARIYLGDGGAYFLGFLIGVFSLVSSHKGTVFAALIAPLFVLALPIVDTSLAIVRRGMQGLPIFRPDRRHLHHRLLNMGLSRRQVVLGFYGLTLLFLGMGFAAFWSRGHWLPILFGLAVLVLLLCAGRLSFSREWFSVGRTLGNSLAMRREIQYALSLTGWLAHEGERCASLEQLFEDLVFAARRLGFTSVRLTLADGQRAWGLPGKSGTVHAIRHELLGGSCGVLELEAPICQGTLEGKAPHSPDGQVCSIPCSQCITNPQLFETTAELLTEAWLKAVKKWKQEQVALNFNAAPPGQPGIPRRYRRVLESGALTGKAAANTLRSLKSGPVSGLNADKL